MVTETPKDCIMQANSQPMTPPPTINSFFGRSFQCTASSDVQTIDGSSGEPGIRMGAEPVATMTLSAVTSCSLPSVDVTITRPGASNRAFPARWTTDRPLNKLAMPPRSCRMILSLCAVIALQSKPTCWPTFTPQLPACLTECSISADDSSALDGMQ